MKPSRLVGALLTFCCAHQLKWREDTLGSSTTGRHYSCKHCFSQPTNLLQGVQSHWVKRTCVSAGDTNDNKTAVGPEDVSKMGCPILGEHTKLEVVIEESYEFKVASITWHDAACTTPSFLYFGASGVTRGTCCAAAKIQLLLPVREGTKMGLLPEFPALTAVSSLNVH